VRQLLFEKILELRKSLGVLDRKDNDRFGIIVIDEVSMITPHFLEHINSRLKQAAGLNIDYGGFLVLLFGDFDQLPPVGATSQSLVQVAQKLAFRSITEHRCNLIEAGEPVQLVRQHASRKRKKKKTNANPSSPAALEEDTNAKKGVELFKKALWMPLLEQVRSEDIEHTRFINRLASGEKIRMSDLKHYKALTREDMDSKEWSFAPIVVCTNRQRLDFTHSQAERFAREHDTCVIRWPVPFKNWTGLPESPWRQAAKQNDPCFWQYFVKGATGYITFNHCVKLGIANGTQVRMDSLTFSDDEEATILQQIQDSNPGDVISLEQPPACVNVELVNVTMNEWRNKMNASSHATSATLSLSDDKVIIPLFRSKVGKTKKYTVRGGAAGGYGYLPSKVEVGRIFEYDLGFAMTVHKAQGRTLPKVILCFDKYPCALTRLTLQHVYVGLSRVKRRSDIRFLLRDPDDYSPLQYITTLEPDEMTMTYFKGFNGPGSTYDASRAYEYALRYQR
jgi:hypothetical protein